MHQSPRLRRLRNDFAALDRLRAESSVFHFQATGNPPHHYQIAFKGKGLWRDHGKVKTIQVHRVEIKLGTSYPRTIPEIRWLTPIYHPNISEIGMVCLGGYGTHWVPSVQLDELCTMLWDMARYHNYDIRSPYNRDAALWVANQTTILFPTDARPIRDLRAAQGRIESANGHDKGGPGENGRRKASGRDDAERPSAMTRVLQFIDRYSRVFGDDPPPIRRDPVGNPEEAAPATPTPAPPTPPEPPAAADAGREAPAPAAETPPPPAPEPPAIPPAPPVDDGVVILEATSEPPRAVPPSRMPAGEEIVFID